MKLTLVLRLMLASLFATSLFAIACGGDDDDSDDTDSVVTGNEPTDRCPSADAMELAVPRAMSGAIDGTAGTIDAPGQVDFYLLTLDAPTFVRIATDSATI